MTNTPKIELLYFPGCPNVEEARNNLEQAIKVFGPVPYEEVNIHDKKSPEDYRNWPSPSILVNGQDVEGTPDAEGAACRIYPGGRAPRFEKILEALNRAIK